MRLHEVVDASREVSATRARNAKVERLAALVRGRDPDLLAIVVPWLCGDMRQGRIGVGWSTLAAVRDTPAAAATGLSVRDVDAAFTAIGAIAGARSNARRSDALKALLGASTPDEQAFLVNLIMGELRQGALAGVLAEGVAKAADVPGDAVRRAAMLSGDLAAAALTALTEGLPGLAKYRLALFRPVQPMLAQTAEDVADALERLGTAAFEAKLDGARVQVHRDDEQVRVYTRALHDVTSAVPEVVEAALALPVRSTILDGEVLALRPDGSPHPFQTTMRRFGRKLDVAALRAELPLTPYFFDALLLDDADLQLAPQSERFAALARVTDRLVPHVVTADPAVATAFLDATLAQGHEGVMAKDPASPYEAGNRGAGWLKIKRPHTLDLVVLAAEWGSGRRQGWLSNLHLGARDPDGGGFVMLGKTFKGLTDALLEWQTAALLARETHREGHVVYVRPEVVVEIAFDEVQDSPRYPGQFALRFARVKRYRDDKPAAEADTIEMVRAIHRRDRDAGRARDDG